MRGHEAVETLGSDAEQQLIAALARFADPEYLPRRCAWCTRLEVDGAFVELPPDVTALFVNRATHGICPDCFDATMVATRQLS